MSTTTQILFNSPALHSLKRDQLVKLCKIHGIKANGKSVDLIERLKQHAQDIPDNVTDAIGDQNDSEQTDQDVDMGEGSSRIGPLPRPSEQWEMVMEDITEVEETGSMGTLSSMNSLRPQGSAGEFGTSNSKTSISTSLKTLASNFGLKRALSKSSSNSKISPNSPDPDLDKHAVPYSSLPLATSLPRTVNFPLSARDLGMDGDVPMDIPGGPARPGRPAPANARLSTGEGLTTTVRLISSTSRDSIMSPPRLQPFKTSFDLIMSPEASNSGPHLSIWPPASPASQGRLYPSLDEIMATGNGTSVSNAVHSPAAPSAGNRAFVAMPNDQAEDIFSPKKHLTAGPSAVARTSVARSEPFLFGSPLPANRPRTSNADFEKAAASVLSEMNQRLAASGVQGVDANVLNKKITVSTDVFGGTLNSTRQRTDSTTDRFAKAHEDAFSKMDSIANHYAARRGAPAASGSITSAQPSSKKRKSEVAGLGPAPGTSKRKSSVVNSRVISNGTRRKMIPGGFGDEDEDEEQEAEDAGDRRSSKRIRVEENQDIHKGRRVSLLAAMAAANGETEEDKAREERKREAMKKKLDEARARRRSSRGRVSAGGKAVPIKPKASRFGFLSSAKSLVRNVWNMGAGGNGAAKVPSNIPVPKASIQPKAAPAPVQASGVPVVKVPSNPTALGLGKPSTSKNTDHLSTVRVSSSTSGKASMLSTDTGNIRKTSSSRARSPIPAFNTSTQLAEDKPASERLRTGSTVGTASRIPSRSTSASGFSSMGARTSGIPGASAVSSIGTRGSLAPSMAGSSSRLRMDSTDSRIPPVPKRLSSTLMAPTASSLAKRQSAIRPGTRSPSTLQQITNSPQSPRSSATPGKIFTTPFTGFGSPTSIPTPVQKPSFAAAGAALFGAATPSTIIGPVPPKPKALVGRKPRISRSRVIAKLGAQRAATAGSSTAGATPAKTRTRSSMGAARRSFGGVKAAGMRNSAGGDMIITAKKRVRQSEIAARRRSRMTHGASRMDVDN